MNIGTLLLAGAATIAFTAATADAATTFTLSQTFDYGYNYNTSTTAPVTITGSFNGNRNGNIITDITNVSLFLNGVAFTGNGNLFVSRYDRQAQRWYTDGAQLTLDNSANNAGFSDSNFGANEFNYNNYFYSLPGYSDNTFSRSAGLYGDNNTTTSRLAIQEVSAPGAVPEPATWGMMLVGFGMVGFGMRRRKSNVRTTVRFA